MPAPTPDPLLLAFGAVISDLRRSRGLSQEAFADLAHFHRTYVAEIETGKRNPTLITVGRIAAALDVGIGDVLLATEARLTNS